MGRLPVGLFAGCFLIAPLLVGQPSTDDQASVLFRSEIAALAKNAK
jgi:hypothetical protein